MLSTILTAATAYISTSIDYLVILMLIFSSTGKKQHWPVFVGDLLGTGVLVTTSLFIAYVLSLVPQTWILGLLGVIPIIMGIKLFVFGENDEGEAIQKGLTKNASIILNVAIITITTCGADNIGIYVPLFAQNATSDIVVILITFLFMLSLFCYIGFLLTRIPFLAEFLEKYSRYLTGVIYSGLGVYILWESGTLTHFFPSYF
ncbi:MAG: cadmium resistance transporter [Liquorilactobacillus hordei]|uniref:cadmium resistance transporter n=1 Tax=Liquorilactobacillus hordei TaxID=468911 RepID=UPI0039ECFAA0